MASSIRATASDVPLTEVAAELADSDDPGAAPHQQDSAIRWSVEEERAAAMASRDRFSYLAEASRCLAESLDYETTLTTVAGLALPYLGAWCIVDVCTDDGGIRRLAVLHPDPEKQAITRELHERYPPRPDDPVGAPRVIRTKRLEVVSEVADGALEASARDATHLRLLRALSGGAYVIAPMVAHGRMLGAITFVTTEAGRRFGELDVLLAEDLANRAALALGNAYLYSEALRAQQNAAAALDAAFATRRAAEVARDEANAARRTAEVANQAKSDFLAVMSHELRTPLNAIAGYADLIDLGVRGPVTPEQRADLGRIQSSQRHLMGLINNVLNYSHLEAGEVHYAIRDVAPDEVLATCETLIAPQVAAQRLTLELDPCDPLLRVRADPERLEQILLNLLTNAVKFTAPGGRLTLVCVPGIDTVAIQVSDTGCGIAPEQQVRIFEPFVQVNARLARTQDGVGLGLAISRDLARDMGGTLTVESVPDQGSTFTLSLPRA